MIGKTKIAAQRTHIGQLLVAAKIISNDSLNEALQLAKSTFLPIGRVLTISGKLREHDLPGLLEAQKLVRAGLVPVDSMVGVLKNAYFCGTVFYEALEQQGWMERESITTAVEHSDECSHEENCDNVLNLLKDACHVTTESINLTAAHCDQIADMPQALYEIGLIDRVLLDLARGSQIKIMEGFVSRKNAILALACYKNSVSTERPSNLKQGFAIRKLVSLRAVTTAEMELPAAA